MIEDREYGLPEHVLELRSRLRAFVDECVIPLEGASMDADQFDLRPEIRQELEAQARKRGLWNLYVPEELGGSSRDLLSRLTVGEEMGRTSAVGPRKSIFGPIPGPILFQLTGALRERYLDPVVRGEKRSAFAQTEPTGGSDPAGMRTTAVRDGDDYVINGRKRFIGMADEADFIQVVAVTDPERRARGGISIFLVDADSPGLRMVRRIPTMMGDAPCELEFTDVRVPVDRMVGEEGQGFRLAQTWITEQRLIHAARGAGVIDRCLELSARYSSSRSSFGSPLADRQSVQWMLVDMYQHLYQLRLMLYDTAQRLMRGEDVRIASYMCKYFGDEASFAAADRAIQIHGAIGLTAEYPFEYLWRQQRSLIITEGSTEVLKMTIARHIRDRYAESGETVTG